MQPVERVEPALRQSDLVDRRTRGLVAIAISDAISERGLRPTTWPITASRSFFGAWSKAPPAFGRARAKGRGMLVLVIALLSAIVVPLMIPIELFRWWRASKHNRLMMRTLEEARARASSPAGYRNTDVSGSWSGALAGTARVFAVDWCVWREGNLEFTGTALAAVGEPEEKKLPLEIVWLTVHRGQPRRGAPDAAELINTLPADRSSTHRWEWSADDPFEAVERSA